MNCTLCDHPATTITDVDSVPTPLCAGCQVAYSEYIEWRRKELTYLYDLWTSAWPEQARGRIGLDDYIAMTIRRWRVEQLEMFADRVEKQVRR